MTNDDMWYELEIGDDGMVASLKRRNYSPESVKAILSLSRQQAYQLDLLLAQFAWSAQQKIEDLEMRLAADAAQSDKEVDLRVVEDYDVS